MAIAFEDLRPHLNAEEVRLLLDHMDYPADARAAKTAQVLQWYHAHAREPIFGARQDNELVGFIALRLSAPGEAEIRQIAVHSRHRRRGIGRQMVAAACQVHGLRTVSAETDRHAVGFYRRLGFVVSSLGEKYPGTERFSCRLTLVGQRPVRPATREGCG